MNSNLTTMATAMIVACLLAGPVLGTDTPALPLERNLGAVSYVTGGVGADEAEAFRRAAAAYPLELQFARKSQPRDEFLSNVNLIIRDRSGKVLLETITEGPFLLARLPAGKYSIEAEHYGVAKRQSVEIRAGARQRHVFLWTTQDNPKELTLASR